MENEKISYLQKTILNWYKQFGRKFPWREQGVGDYKLLISEILLQRTKVETVAKFYKIFFLKYPNWNLLCKASLKELEVTLKPIGLYKQRAKRLFLLAEKHKITKRKIITGRKEITAMGYSGLYLGNAYELFVLSRPKPLLDVNMIRLLQRYFDLKGGVDVRRDRYLQSLAEKVVKNKNFKKLNWAILDYAAMVCKSKKPSCKECIIAAHCKYFALDQSKKYLKVAEPTILYQPRLRIDSDFNSDNKKNIRCLSLFSGCGGMDLGLEGGFVVHKNSINPKVNPGFIDSYVSENYIKLASTRFRVVFANDIMPDAKRAWVNHFTKLGYSSEVFHQSSIVQLVKLHKDGINVFPESIDIVTGGFPCQDFSISGSRKGFNSRKDHMGKASENEIPIEETRGKLYAWMKEVIEITKPKIFIAENVKGLVNLSNIKEIIQNDFSAANGNDYFVLPPQVLKAYNYGVPQSRERVIFIGIKKSALNKAALEALMLENIPDEYNPYPSPSHAIDFKNNGLEQIQTLKNVFEVVSEPEESDDLSQKFYSKAKYMGAHCQGQTEINLDGIAPTIRAEHHGNIEYRRLSVQHGGKIVNELKIGRIERRLTPRECAIIQTFPLDYEFVIPRSHSGKNFLLSPSAAYKIIGNAVPPLLAYHIGKRIEHLWSLYFE